MRLRPSVLLALISLPTASACARELELPSPPAPGEAPRCGDGVLRDGELCDDGNLVDGDGCDGNCTPSGCGNGVRAKLEACDDGNAVDDDGCDSDCSLTACGNGVVTAGEECDERGESARCDEDCSFLACGDGVQNLVAGEACDDGNALDEDGCVAGADQRCRLARCGDGHVQRLPAGLEACDAGGAQSADCELDCRSPRCGDGTANVLAGEACDRGERWAWDGCWDCAPSEFQLNASEIEHQRHVAVGLSATGSSVWVWTGLDGESTGIRGRLIGADGESRGPELAINNVIGDPQRYPDVAVRRDGSFLVAWINDWQDDLRVRSFSADGTPRGVERTIEAFGEGAASSVRLAVGEPDAQGRSTGLLVWASCCGDPAAGPAPQRLRAARLTDDGTTLTLAPLPDVATDLATSGDGSSNGAGTPFGLDAFDVSPDPRGGFVVAWISTTDAGRIVRYRRLNAALIAAGPVPVHGPPYAEYVLSLGVDASTGAVAIAWNANVLDGVGPGLFLRAFDAADLPVAPAQRIDPAPPNRVYSLGVARTAARIGVVWADDDGRGEADDDASQQLVFARWFDDATTALGPPARLAIHEASSQREPKLAATADGRFAAGWSATGQDPHESGAFGARIDETGASLGRAPW